ncbi:MAG TPA: tetratricopeptide repeat protein, partial [Acidiferrobacterales bacterium]
MDSHNPDDQVERFKAWWENYGNALIAGVLIGAGLLGGINYWRHHKAEQAAAASQVYDRMLTAVQQRRVADAGREGEQLMQDYARTPYAGKAALILARVRWEAGEADSARQALEWAAEHADDATRHAARLHLARLLLHAGEIDAAARLAETRDPGGFAADYADLRGDVLVAQGDRAAARAAYREALERSSA